MQFSTTFFFAGAALALTTEAARHQYEYEYVYRFQGTTTVTRTKTRTIGAKITSCTSHQYSFNDGNRYQYTKTDTGSGSTYKITQLTNEEYEALQQAKDKAQKQRNLVNEAQNDFERTENLTEFCAYVPKHLLNKIEVCRDYLHTHTIDTTVVNEDGRIGKETSSTTVGEDYNHNHNTNTEHNIKNNGDVRAESTTSSTDSATVDGNNIHLHGTNTETIKVDTADGESMTGTKTQSQTITNGHAHGHETSHVTGYSYENPLDYYKNYRWHGVTTTWDDYEGAQYRTGGLVEIPEEGLQAHDCLYPGLYEPDWYDEEN
eukprot:Pgem_evm1s18329